MDQNKDAKDQKKQKTPDKKTFLDKHNIVVGQKLDSGGFGIVYKGLMRGENVAIKVMKIARVDKQDLDRELDILKVVKHDHIVRCYMIQRTHNHVWIIMELESGGSIGKWVRKYGSIPPWQSVNFIIPCIEALIYLHSKNIAHRDLKLDNILLDDHLEPKLTDFGLSRFFKESEDRLSTTFCGTKTYMALEVQLRKRYNPMIADVWSLGVCLYIMIYAEAPFEKKDEQKMITQMRKQEFRVKNIGVDAALEERAKKLFRKMMHPEPDKRIKFADCLKDDFITNPYASS
ncbi:serine/threonine-protein kinase-like protein 2 [Leptotrombidium deliense]|uniref:Serine/threonine-protein kinase-like protein 2 n=1 Tax=Leptotrombidium deliense TaxID=299467 RepID=A0A443SB06_9ACAR|nr:serine/threonine-protein kinase-like protein 2 [Leptotrombidium deliense]